MRKWWPVHWCPIRLSVAHCLWYRFWIQWKDKMYEKSKKIIIIIEQIQHFNSIVQALLMSDEGIVASSEPNE